MTRDEAIKILKARKNCESDSCPSGVVCYKCDEAFDMAIEALELVTSYEGTINKLTEALNQQKEGHWIQKEGIYGVSFCDRCDFELTINDTNFCPNCGARMIEPHESEVNNG